MGWRDKYPVHCAADVFPIMEGEELAALVEDIKANGLKIPITEDNDGLVLDGRNRLNALDLAGIELRSWQIQIYPGDDPVGFIISANVHRRHLTKAQQADLIVAARTAGAKPLQDEAVSKGGRGKVNSIKQACIADAKKQGISKSTVERSYAKAEGNPPSDKKRHRRSDAEIERDLFLNFLSSIATQNDIDAPRLSDAALKLLTMEQTAEAIEVFETAMARMPSKASRSRFPPTPIPPSWAASATTRGAGAAWVSGRIWTQQGPKPASV